MHVWLLGGVFSLRVDGAEGGTIAHALAGRDLPASGPLGRVGDDVGDELADGRALGRTARLAGQHHLVRARPHGPLLEQRRYRTGAVGEPGALDGR